MEFWTDQRCGRHLYGGLVLLPLPNQSHLSSTYPTNEELNNLRFAPKARLVIIANNSNSIRNVFNHMLYSAILALILIAISSLAQAWLNFQRNTLQLYPSIEDNWEVRFSNELQTNNRNPLVLLLGTRKNLGR